MTGNVVNSYSTVNTYSLSNNISSHNSTMYSPLEVATAVTFMVGIYQVKNIFMYVRFIEKSIINTIGYNIFLICVAGLISRINCL